MSILFSVALDIITCRPALAVDEVSRVQRLYFAKTVRFFGRGDPSPTIYTLSFVRKNRSFFSGGADGFPNTNEMSVWGSEPAPPLPKIVCFGDMGGVSGRRL